MTDNANSIPKATSGSRSKMLSGNFKNFLSKPAISHPQKALTVQLFNAEQKTKDKERHRGGEGTAKHADRLEEK
jgi:hypothetical protein